MSVCLSVKKTVWCQTIAASIGILEIIFVFFQPVLADALNVPRTLIPLLEQLSPSAQSVPQDISRNHPENVNVSMMMNIINR